MAGFIRRYVIEGTVGKEAADNLDRRMLARRAAMIKFNDALLNLIDAWESEDEALKEVYGTVTARKINGQEATNPAEVLRIFADAIDDSEDEDEG